jgi:hypothetical protein
LVRPSGFSQGWAYGIDVRVAVSQGAPGLTLASDFSFESLLKQLQGKASTVLSSMQARMADRLITVDCDDQAFAELFFMMFGGSSGVPGSPSARNPAILSDVHLDISSTGHPQFGWFRLSGRNELPLDGVEFRYAIEAEHGFFKLLPTEDDGWTSVAFRDSDVPMFAFRDRDCIFSLGPKWRLSIVWFLHWRLLRIRPDVIFFHASALGIFGEGTIFVGPSGGGKSTTSMALAARGHNFLSDEVGAYVPATGELLPFRRPVGIKPGPRATAVQRGLPHSASEQIEREGFYRVDVDAIFANEPAKPVPLRRIVFLRGFAEHPTLERIKPGREEIVELQPLMSSFLNASHSRRIFELTRLLGTAKVYQLHPGNPDETAIYLEEAFKCE